MKSFYLFLFLFLCSACSNFGKKEILDEELSKMPILSVPFDSLLSEVRNLPSRDRIASMIKISYRNEEEIDGILKQRQLLMEVLPLSSGKNRKTILFQLVTIYNKLDRFGISDAYFEGLKWIEMLETDHSLSQKEEWQLNEMKALLLNGVGNQEEFLPIWYKLLKQYREADRAEDVGKCLLTIASHFVMLEDYDNALPLYKEAYQLALDYDFADLQKASGISLIKYIAGCFRCLYRISRKKHDPCDQNSAEEKEYICADSPLITLLRPLSDQKISKWNYNTQQQCYNE